MANDLSKNPLVIDTVGQVLTGKGISVYSVQWINPSNVDHTVVLQDGNGNTIFEDVCVLAKQSKIRYLRPGYVYNGLNLVTLDSGKLHVQINWVDDGSPRPYPYKDGV